jgi:serine/threonine protein kinase
VNPPAAHDPAAPDNGSERPGAPELPGYRFLRDIGAGGNAKVYLYEQELPSRKVAVKVLNDPALSVAARRRFTAEANVTAVLAHRHIVQVFDAKLTADGQPYIVMPFYPQPNLAVRARRTHFSVAEVLRIGIQVGSAVETSHRHGVLHRDIKPQNILTDSYGEPALTDFGIATTKAGDGPEGLSVPWSPPEILFGTGPGDERSDVYSLGATLWHLLIGRPPFEQPRGGNATQQVMERIYSDNPPRTQRADVPDSLERLLRQTMAKDPAARPQSAMELIRGLQSIEQELRLPLTHPILPAAEPEHEDTRGDTVARPAARGTDATFGDDWASGSSVGGVSSGMAPTGMAPTGMASIGGLPVQAAGTAPSGSQAPGAQAPGSSLSGSSLSVPPVSGSPASAPLISGLPTSGTAPSGTGPSGTAPSGTAASETPAAGGLPTGRTLQPVPIQPVRVSPAPVSPAPPAPASSAPASSAPAPSSPPSVQPSEADDVGDLTIVRGRQSPVISGQPPAIAGRPPVIDARPPASSVGPPVISGQPTTAGQSPAAPGQLAAVPATAQPAGDYAPPARPPVLLDPSGGVPPQSRAPRPRQFPAGAFPSGQADDATVVRPARPRPAGPQPTGPGPADLPEAAPPETAAERPSTAQRRLLLFVGGGVLLAVAVVAALLAIPHSAGSPSATPVGPGQATQQDNGQSALGPGTLAPGQPVVTVLRINASQVEFSWTYANSAPGDTFRWQELNGTSSQPVGVVTKPDLVLTVAHGQSACIQVTVRSADGQASEASAPVCMTE